jgi:integrase
MTENEPSEASSESETEGTGTKTTLPEILSYDEIDRFLLAADDLEDMLAARLMLFAGLRVSEVTALLVRDLDRERCAVFVRQGKGSKDRWAPCDVHTIALGRSLAARWSWTSDHALFELSTRTVQRHIEALYRKAGITWGAGCHTLRHTCATWQLDKGISLEVVRENLGHEDIKTTQIYLHLNIRQRSRTYREAVRFGL